MPVAYRLQELVSVSAVETQDVQNAVDNLQYSQIVVQVRVPVAASTGTLKLQHSATLDEDAFIDVDTVSFDIGTAGSDYATATGLLRYLRWSVSSITGTAQFMIDVVARET